MWDQIKNDRVAQLLLAGIGLAGCVVVGIFGYVGVTLLTSSSLTPHPSPQQYLEQNGFVFQVGFPHEEKPGVTKVPCLGLHGAQCGIHVDEAGRLVELGTIVTQDKVASARTIVLMIEATGVSWPEASQWVEMALANPGEHIERRGGFEFKIVNTPLLGVFVGMPVEE